MYSIRQEVTLCKNLRFNDALRSGHQNENSLNPKNKIKMLFKSTFTGLK